MTTTDRRTAINRLADTQAGDGVLVLGTTPFIGEGFDAPTLDTLFLAAGERGKVGRSARINVDYAGEWAKKPWRFYERGNRYVSVPPRD